MNAQSSKTYHVIGVMSGTSLDGIDLAYCCLYKTEHWCYEIYEAETYPYPVRWKNKLQGAVHLEPQELTTLDIDYTKYLAMVIARFLKRIIKTSVYTGVDAVCSHGHTVFHQPEKGMTLQIGNLPLLAKLLNKTVVCDFRKQDVALGGQGAPLVPIGDELLFGNYDYCLNLGGFANISTNRESHRMAYDICPVNIVLNPLAERLGVPYDDGGKLSKSGKLLPELLEKLNELPYYQQPPPKSLGLEWILKNVFPLLKSNYKTEDILHTFTEHIAMQLANNFNEKTTVLATGGGTYNTYLLERIKAHKALELVLPDKVLIDYKEALIFGLLGILKLHNEINCLASVTGAKHDHSAGVVFNNP